MQIREELEGAASSDAFRLLSGLVHIHAAAMAMEPLRGRADRTLQQEQVRLLRHELGRTGVLFEWPWHTGLQLQSQLEQRGFHPAISASQLLELFLLLRDEASRTVLAGQPTGGQAGQAPGLGDVRLAQQMVADSQQLCSMRPHSVPSMLRHARALALVDGLEKAKGQLVAAMSAAQASNCECGFFTCTAEICP